MADLTPLVNGIAYSYSDIIVTVLGSVLAGISEVKYEDNQEVVNNFGAGRLPVSQGHGPITTEASIKIDRAELTALIKAAPGKRLQNIGNFDVNVSYVPLGGIPTTDVIRNCRFMNTPGGAAQGDTTVEAELKLMPSHIDWDI
tara:strand:- start:9576 stop:10004 length:429 start_codon:yes stop_codon:yes gene_type:complete